MATTSVPSNYAEIVHAERRARAWTQAELAKRIGLTNVTISRWERGRVAPSPAFWRKFIETMWSNPGFPALAMADSEAPMLVKGFYEEAVRRLSSLIDAMEEQMVMVQKLGNSVPAALPSNGLRGSLRHVLSGGRAV